MLKSAHGQANLTAYRVKAGVTIVIKATSPSKAESYVRQLLGEEFNVVLVQVED